MPEEVEVRPADLRHGAARLRDDVGLLRAVGGRAVDGVGAAATAAGDGPLAEAADSLTARLTTLLIAVTRSVAECAEALDAASTRYLTADGAAADGFGGPAIVLPGLEPPR